MSAVPPRFDGPYGEDAEARSVVLNHTTRLQCPVHAIPPPQITWYKNSEELGGDQLGGERVKLLEGGRELEISRAVLEDRARYTCVARNLAGEMEKSYDLEVLGE